MAKQKHPKCIVDGCEKVRVAKCDGMCTAHFKEYGSRDAYYASVETQKTPETVKFEQTRGVSTPEQKIEQCIDSGWRTKTANVPPPSVSFLARVKAIPAAIPPLSILVDFTGHDELFAEVTANSEDISAGIIELIQLYMAGKLRMAS